MRKKDFKTTNKKFTVESGAGEEGTDQLSYKYKKDTPGQSTNGKTMKKEKFVPTTVKNEDVADFMGAVSQAAAAGKKEFEFGGKTYKVTLKNKGVAKKIVKSMDEASDKELDIKSIEDLMKNPDARMIKQYGSKSKYLKMLKSKLDRLNEAAANDYADLSDKEISTMIALFRNVGRKAAAPILTALKRERQKRSLKEVNESTMDKVNAIVSDKQAAKIGGKMIDMQTASVIAQIYNKVSDAAKKKMENEKIERLVGFAQQVMKKEDSTNNKSDDGEGLDKVQPKAVKKKFDDRKDKDIDNDGDVDSSDEYIHAKRKAINKAIKNESIKEAVVYRDIRIAIELLKTTPAAVKFRNQIAKKDQDAPISASDLKKAKEIFANPTDKDKANIEKKRKDRYFPRFGVKALTENLKEDYQKVLDAMVKNGSNKKEAEALLKKYYPYVDKTYRSSSASKKAEIIVSLAASESTDLEEANYQLYHNTFTDASKAALDLAKKKGFEVDEDDWFNQVSTGPKKPGKGKTNRYTVKVTKNGKETKKRLSFQVYGMDSGKYELNAYVESTQIQEAVVYRDIVHALRLLTDRDGIKVAGELAKKDQDAKISSSDLKKAKEVFSKMNDKDTASIAKKKNDKYFPKFGVKALTEESVDLEEGVAYVTNGKKTYMFNSTSRALDMYDSLGGSAKGWKVVTDPSKIKGTKVIKESVKWWTVTITKKAGKLFKGQTVDVKANNSAEAIKKGIKQMKGNPILVPSGSVDAVLGESIKEAAKPSNGKSTVGIDVVDAKAAMKGMKKFKLKGKQGNGSANEIIVTGKNVDIFKYLRSKAYDMDTDEIEEFYPELFESVELEETAATTQMVIKALKLKGGSKATALAQKLSAPEYVNAPLPKSVINIAKKLLKGQITKFVKEAADLEKTNVLSSDEYDEVQNFKNFNKRDWKWDKKKSLYVRKKKVNEAADLEEAASPFKSLEAAWLRTAGDEKKQARLIKKHNLKQIISKVRPGAIKLGVMNDLNAKGKQNYTAAGLDADGELIFVTNNPTKIYYPKSNSKRPEGIALESLEFTRVKGIVERVTGVADVDFIVESEVNSSWTASAILNAYTKYKILNG